MNTIANAIIWHLQYRLKEQWRDVEHRIDAAALEKVAVRAVIDSGQAVTRDGRDNALRKADSYRQQLGASIADGNRRVDRETELRDMALALLIQHAPHIELPRELASVRDMHYASGKWQP